MRLAHEVYHMPVDVMLEQLTSRELTEWHVYFNLEEYRQKLETDKPIDRDDQAAQIQKLLGVADAVTNPLPDKASNG